MIPLSDLMLMLTLINVKQLDLHQNLVQELTTKTI